MYILTRRRTKSWRQFCSRICNIIATKKIKEDAVLKKNGIFFIIFYINLLKRLHNSKKKLYFCGRFAACCYWHLNVCWITHYCTVCADISWCPMANMRNSPRVRISKGVGDYWFANSNYRQSDNQIYPQWRALYPTRWRNLHHNGHKSAIKCIKIWSIKKKVVPLHAFSAFCVRCWTMLSNAKQRSQRSRRRHWTIIIY